MKIDLLPVVLVSNNIHNFRHGREHPVITRVVKMKPNEKLEKRICYEVMYLSDRKIDYIPVSSVEAGEWRLV